MSERGIVGNITWTSTLDYGQVGALTYAGSVAAGGGGGGGGGALGLTRLDYPVRAKRLFPTHAQRAFPHE
jgi:hypothetical protein